MGIPTGAHQMSQEEMRGHSYPGEGEVATQVLPTVQGYRNPGPTENLRGVEANTNRDNGTRVVVEGITAPAIECEP